MLFMWLQGKSRKVRHQRSAHCLGAPFQGVCPGHWHSCDKTESFEWESPWRTCDRPTRVKRGDGWTCGVCLIILHLITILSQALVIYLYMRTIRWFICVPSMWHFCISFLWFITISYYLNIKHLNWSWNELNCVVIVQFKLPIYTKPCQYSMEWSYIYQH